MAFFSNLKITNCGQKGRIVVASRAFVYTNAIFALQNACWAVPNPLHSAPFRCRLRVFSKRFYLYKVTVFKFYDAGIRDNRHYYEVHMSSQVFDSYYYYTYHTFQIKPSGNSEWWTHNVTHQSADHKTIVADSMNYSYPVGSEPKNPTVSVKASFSIKNYGSFTLKAVTLSRPESL